MIDLHCHLLPGLDDGPKSLNTSLEMARTAVADGVKIIACTPHIYPGLYMNNTLSINSACAALRYELQKNNIPLQLVVGADIHMVPDLLGKLQNGTAPTINNSRYFLLEPAHHVKSPKFKETVARFITNGFVPIITHPERLSWVRSGYEIFSELVKMGVWIQLTASSITGGFGKESKYWAERFLGDGFTHVIASDAHNNQIRSPILSDALKIVERAMGSTEAQLMVVGRPQAVLNNTPPTELPRVPAFVGEYVTDHEIIRFKGKPWYRRWI